MKNDNAPMKKPVDWDELYPGRFLKSGQFGDKKVTLTIADVSLDKLTGDDGQAKVKGIVAFRETELQLALNKTNGICLREMFGRDLSKWNGRRVTLFASEYNGEPCIRVWGSPELREDRTITIKLPKKSPKTHVLHAVQAKGTLPQRGARVAAPATKPAEPPPPPSVDDLDDDEPADDMDPDPTAASHDPETGEVHAARGNDDGGLF